LGIAPGWVRIPGRLASFPWRKNCEIHHKDSEEADKPELSPTVFLASLCIFVVHFWPVATQACRSSGAKSLFVTNRRCLVADTLVHAVALGRCAPCGQQGVHSRLRRRIAATRAADVAASLLRQYRKSARFRCEWRSKNFRRTSIEPRRNGPGALSQPGLFARGRQGWILRDVGATGAFCVRAMCRIPVAASANSNRLPGGLQ
jgi:hypothetical protein